MIHVKEAVIVEGKYDKIKLSSIIDGLILQTNGFRIFKDPQQMALIRSLADSRGILILTDSDSAGFLIRNYLSGCIAPEKIRHVYIPDLLGKEKRKEKPSKEGKLGVEGMPLAVLKEALLRAGVGVGEEQAAESRRITKADLFAHGLSGGPESAKKRAALLKRLSLPEYLSANALPEVLSGMMSYDEFVRIAAEL
ncbi:toprim domain-containing protein [Caproicibacter sp.]|uniref:toprim domain-containing protein n=1 Tax=Caproicibacter sp. TaxID=2814884 RepID=UPI0039892435